MCQILAYGFNAAWGGGEKISQNRHEKFSKNCRDWSVAENEAIRSIKGLFI